MRQNYIVWDCHFAECEVFAQYFQPTNLLVRAHGADDIVFCAVFGEKVFQEWGRWKQLHF